MSNDARLNDHLANERTFLAWSRTGIGIMAFGFVVERFSIFIRQISSLLGKNPIAHTPPSGYSSIFGVILVGYGVLLCIFAYIKFKRIEGQINDENYYSSTKLDLLLTISVFLVGLLLIGYLITSV